MSRRCSGRRSWGCWLSAQHRHQAPDPHHRQQCVDSGHTVRAALPIGGYAQGARGLYFHEQPAAEPDADCRAAPSLLHLPGKYDEKGEHGRRTLGATRFSPITVSLLNLSYCSVSTATLLLVSTPASNWSPCI